MKQWHALPETVLGTRPPPLIYHDFILLIFLLVLPWHLWRFLWPMEALSRLPEVIFLQDVYCLSLSFVGYHLEISLVLWVQEQMLLLLQGTVQDAVYSWLSINPMCEDGHHGALDGNGDEEERVHEWSATCAMCLCVWLFQVMILLFFCVLLLDAWQWLLIPWRFKLYNKWCLLVLCYIMHLVSFLDQSLAHGDFKPVVFFYEALLRSLYSLCNLGAALDSPDSASCVFYYGVCDNNLRGTQCILADC